ncbi:MAG: TatD family hydrolase [Sphaerochaetaceae bacterium]|jgi:TatD DNase family protein|nr:TatD family hydrolase [Sphaerochaetaceae bacterium]NLO60386.1 TatD family hydrolase [Spirochaetales bacterium]MDD2406171.1 TatD family hydrolase [Sphaerochaetaceae bacterium]MDD3670349.1 TatD family hydrolase [Sphaerochaetaceae bacterium]MDD4258796.1 TatD family hydrolase [Sphaerochaetaceae bacterium]
MQLFDTHAHIGLIHEDQMEQLLIIQLAKRKSVTHIVSICNSLIDFTQVYENLKTASNVYHAVGVSPSEVTNPGQDWEHKLDNYSKWERVVAIGETGLDYYRNYGDKGSQVELFIKQLDIARTLQMPVVIHNREAGKDILDILRNRLSDAGGILHCYSEDWAYARQALELPLYFSFAGNITYKNVKHLHDTIANLPLDRILIESESPFMVPSAYKGKRNKPAYLVETAQAVADIRGISLEEASDALYRNSLCAFHLPENA